MESPYGRPVAVEVIYEALRLAEAGEAGGSIGLSKETQIYQALQAAGYLTGAAMEPSV